MPKFNYTPDPALPHCIYLPPNEEQVMIMFHVLRAVTGERRKRA